MLKPSEIVPSIKANKREVEETVKAVEDELRTTGVCELRMGWENAAVLFAVAREARAAGWVAYAASTETGRSLFIEHPDLSLHQPASSTGPKAAAKREVTEASHAKRDVTGGKEGARLTPERASARTSDKP